MATLKEANQAREEHSAYLQKKLGAHAIMVDRVEDDGGKKTFGVIAYYDALPPREDTPENLEIKHGGKVKKIPLRSEIAPMAELE